MTNNEHPARYFWTRHPSAKTWAETYVDAQLNAAIQDIVARGANQVACLMSPDPLDNPADRLPEAMRYIQRIVASRISEAQDRLYGEINQ